MLFYLTVYRSASVEKVKSDEQITWPTSVTPIRYRSTRALPCGYISSHLKQLKIIPVPLSSIRSVIFQSVSWYHSMESSDGKLKKEFRSRKYIPKRQDQFPYTTKILFTSNPLYHSSFTTGSRHSLSTWGPFDTWTTVNFFSSLISKGNEVEIPEHRLEDNIKED